MGISRRQFLTGSAMAAAGAMGPSRGLLPAPRAAAQSGTLTVWGWAGTYEGIESQIEAFNQKYPDVMEVGYGVFHAMYDWHIRNRVPLTVGRAADGRYGLVFMFTRLILRPDAVPDFIGLPYDQRA